MSITSDITKPVSHKDFWRRSLLAVVFANSVLIGDQSAWAGQERTSSTFAMTCGREDGSRMTCPFGFQASDVVLDRQSSAAACLDNTRWRATDRAITVEGGCEGRFLVTMPGMRPRVLIMTDIGQDPDDTQSLVRALLYANDLSIEGIIPTYRPGNRAVGSDLVRAVVRAYRKDLPQLRQHDIRYPDADELESRIKLGLRTNQQIGTSHDSTGSNHLIKRADASDEPLWVLVWGGSRELAQAIHKVRRTRSAKEFTKFQKKLRVYTIGWSQYSPEPAEYMKTYANDMFWISSASYDGSKTATFRGMYMLGDTSMQNREWMEQHITSKGHLGGMYPLFTTEDGLKEGDTPSLLHVLPIGLNDPDQPAEGGWGGRYEKEKEFAGISRNFYSSKTVEDRLGDATDRRLSVARWRPAFQADFAARAAWLELGHAEANHPPEPQIEGPTTRSVKSGETVVLDATSSSDPDGDDLTFRWQVYEEVSSTSAEIVVNDADAAVATLVAPTVKEPETIDLILATRDNGVPELTRYQRIRLTITP